MPKARSGVRSGVKRTPAFLINGLRLDRAWDAATLTSAIRAAARIDQRTMR